MKPIPAEQIVEGLSEDLQDLLVREAFVRLWNEGLIYRGERLVNNRWAYVRLTGFQDGSSDELVAALDRGEARTATP